MKFIKISLSNNEDKEWQDFSVNQLFKDDKPNELRWFVWTDPSGEQWDIAYKYTDNLYDQSGKALPNKTIIEQMITDIQNVKSSDHIPQEKIGEFLNIFPILQDEFFDKVNETDQEFKDERRIEERDLKNQGLI